MGAGLLRGVEAAHQTNVPGFSEDTKVIQSRFAALLEMAVRPVRGGG